MTHSPRALAALVLASLFTAGCPAEAPGALDADDAIDADDGLAVDTTPDDSESSDIGDTSVPDVGDVVDTSVPDVGNVNDTSGPDGEVTAADRIDPGGTVIVQIPSEGRAIAVRVTAPTTARYPTGAPVIVEVSTFFTPRGGFYASVDVGEIGGIGVAYLWPGTRDNPTGSASEGSYDHGGPTDITALRDVLRYASGALADVDGHLLADRMPAPPIDVVGLYAFSHPGIGAMNVMSLHGAALPAIDFVIGRENPSIDIISTVELGYYTDQNAFVLNPLYQYPESFAPDVITFDHTGARWDPATDRPYFDVDASGTPTAGDFPFGTQIPQMWDKRFFSRATTHALAATIPPTEWPADVATPELADATWPFRSTTRATYLAIAAARPDLHLMLVFADREHVQPQIDKPSVHHAYEGLRAAGLWTRMNADRAYAEATRGQSWPGFPDNDANLATTEATWNDGRSLSYDNVPGANEFAARAALAEMCDRAFTGTWSPNLAGVIERD